METIKNFGKWVKAKYVASSNAFKAAVNSAWQSFAAVFGIALMGWITDVAKWAGEVEGTFPSVSPVGKAAVAGAASAATFLVTYIFRTARAKSSPYAGPKYGG